MSNRSKPSTPPLAFLTAPLGECTADEKTILENAPGDLRKALHLRRWFEGASATAGGLHRFQLTRTEHDSEMSYGFFGRAPMDEGFDMRVMGNVQEMFFDRAKRSPGGIVPPEEMCRQVRAFVLRYFMRISTFLQPEREGGQDRASAVRHREGFGYTQHFAKPRGGEGVRFAPEEECRIIDLRDIGPVWDWIICRLRFHNFQIGLRPLGASGPQVAFDLKAENYIILSPELIIDRENPEPGVAGEYGFGYAAIRNPVPGVLAYGPGRFETAVQVVRWRVLETGEVRTRMEFMSNRPKHVSRVDLDPVHWGLEMAEFASLGLVSPISRRLRAAWDKVVRLDAAIDPVYVLVDGVNAITNGKAARDWSISREQLDKELLLLHFRQHYRAVLGSLRAWRQVQNWTQESEIPRWAAGGADPQ